jgi:hypothetical protein
VYPKEELLSAKLSVLAKTSLFQSHQEIEGKVNQPSSGEWLSSWPFSLRFSSPFAGSCSTDLEARRTKEEESFKDADERSKSLRVWIESNKEEIEKLKTEKKYNLAYLKKTYKVSPDQQLHGLGVA